MTKQEALFNYLLRLGDQHLILGHRLSEQSSKGPFLEEDIACSNIALDLIGNANHLLQYAAEVENKNRTADDLAFLRSEREFYNTLLAEQPNGDFGFVMTRHFFADVFDFYLYSELQNSSDETLASIASKALKEITYHLRHTSKWMIRLGDGTEESKTRVQNSINELYRFTGELFEMDEVDEILIKEKISVDLSSIKNAWLAKVKEVFSEAGLTIPEDVYMQTGSRKAQHTEHLGFLLAEMQHLHRAFPGAQW
jgi:ring-1,2-phenylacetyl-CoA epoxidase subunit PaaC